VGKKFGKNEKGVFKPFERVCLLDDSEGQPKPKNAKYETFAFAFLTNSEDLHK
jgi:hypothetical protein